MDAGASPLPARRRGPRAVLSVLVVLALVSTGLAALVAAGAVAVGLAAERTADRYLSLPEALPRTTFPQRSVMVDADGRPFAWLWEQDRQVVPLERIAPVMRQAVIDIEDSRFYEHEGVDVRAVGRALVRDQVGELTGREVDQEGASTLVQQYVKNLRLAAADSEAERDDAQEHSYTRKLEEARFALELAETTSKDDILAGYLNLVYFGNGAYGVQAAAERYFDVDAADLTLTQAALLAGLVKDPSALDPTENPRDAKARRDLVLDRMLELGHLTPAQHAAAVRAGLGLRPGGHPQGCSGAYGYFCDSVRRQLLADPRLGPDEESRERVLETGGLTIATTLDRQVQRAAVKATSRARTSRASLAAAVVEPGTGAVLALAASRPFGVSDGDTSVNLPVGGSSGFQAGSTFKVFVLAQALAQGIPRDLVLTAPEVYVGSDHGKPYRVGNAADGESGRYTLPEATWHSVNTWFMQLQDRTGVQWPARLAEAMGVRRVDGDPLGRVPSFTLGTDEVSPLSMAGAYATLAARGVHCRPYAVAAVDPAPGTTTVPGGEVARPDCRRVLPERVADRVTSILTGVIRRGTGAAADPGRPAAGKTGTVQDFSSAWFTGYTPQLAAAVWMGDPRGGYRYPLRDVEVDGTRHARVYGGGVPAETWGDLVRRALEG